MQPFFIFSNQRFEDAESFGKLYYLGSCHIINNHCFYFESYLYAETKQFNLYFDEYSLDAERFAKNCKGEFLLADYCKDTNEFTLITDRFAKIPIYIYNREDRIIISSDYWRLIKILSPSENDIDWLAIKTMAIHSFILNCDTLVKHLKRIPTASIYRAKLDENDAFLCNRYWRLSFKEDPNLTLQQAAKKMEEIFNNTFHTLKSKFPADTRFGIGVSGGWDSRLLLDYCNRFNMKVVPYCIGQKYYRYPFVTNGYRVLNRILKMYNLVDFKFIEHDSEDYYTKLSDDVRLAPLKSADFMIGCKSQVPDFDVMLNGEHGGVFLGEFDYKKILAYGINDVYKYVLTFLSYPKDKDMIQSEQEQSKIESMLIDYISEMESTNKYEIFFRCFFEIYGSMSKTGFFETIYLSHERYTPYLDPAFVDFFQTWNMQFLVNRTLQREFFMTYHTDLSKMPDETSDAPLYWRDYDVHYCLKRFKYAAKNKLFGSSLRRQEWIEEDKEYKDIARKVIFNNQQRLKEHFPELDTEKFMKSNPRAFANLIKMLIEVNCIINGGTDHIRDYMM